MLQAVAPVEESIGRRFPGSPNAGRPGTPGAGCYTARMRKTHLLSKLAACRTIGFAWILAAASCVTGPAFAQQSDAGLQSYDVELVIFRVLSSNATPEQWSLESPTAGHHPAIPDDEPSPFTNDGSEAPPPATAPVVGFPALPPAKYKLTAMEETLRRSRNYQPLAHIGWTQPGFPRNGAQFLSIDSLVPPATGLTGQVALTRGRYLHLTLDLAYDAPGASGEPGQRFVLRQTRRMRSNERHYLDHPRFGVIAIVTPSTP
jgi:Peptidoglycan-binding protein, CsiV